jgi:hypothetical protein
MLAVFNLMLARFLKLIGLLLISAAGALKAQEVSIVVEAGHMVATDLNNNMPGLAGSPAAQQMAERIGDITYTGTRYILDTKVLNGTNFAGTISATVTVTETGTYSGSFTAGVPGALSGTVGAALGQTVTGTHNMAITWMTEITTGGQLRINYWIGIGAETRHGAFMLPVHTRHLEPWNETQQEPQPADYPDPAAYGADYWSWYFDILGTGYMGSRGSVIIHEMEILDWWPS